MDPLVSVIVPVYNVRPFIQEAIDSIINQTYRNLEILLIDDGSTDGSGEICDEYAGNDSRVRVIHQENRGLSAARNAGLDIMNGDFVAFLDPDDAFHSTFIEKNLSVLLSEDADMTLCNFTVHYTTGKIVNTSSRKKLPLIEPGVYDRYKTISKLVNSKINVSVWNKLYRRKLWNSVRFAEGHVHEDHEASYKICCLLEKLCVLSDTMYYRRKRPGSITMVISQKNIDDALLAYKNIEDFICNNIPDLFSKKQFLFYKHKRFRFMLSSYYRARKIADKTKHDYRKTIRQMIIETGKQFGVYELQFNERTAYNMICKCPWLFDFCYPCYMTLRKAAYAVFRR